VFEENPDVARILRYLDALGKTNLSVMREACRKTFMC
jgi:hypothetical protein